MESAEPNVAEVNSASGSDTLKDGNIPSRPSSTGRSSPPPDCAICLGQCRNVSFTDSCLHRFCFNCLLTWSRIKAECPLCKQPFKSIIHNVRSNHQYEEYYVHQQEAEEIVQMAELDTFYDAPRFRYRTTLTLHRHEGLAIQQLLMRYPQNTLQRVHELPSGTPPQQRRRNRTSALFRESVYRHRLWARPLPDVTGRYRDCSPEFYRQNPAQIHRLVPWLERDLSILTPSYSMALSTITDQLTVYPIISPTFQQMLRPFLGGFTDHFLHEFYSFASSPFDMIGYDRAVQYGSAGMRVPRIIEHIVNEVSSSSNLDSDDSDIIVVSSEPGPSSAFPIPFNSLPPEGGASTSRRLGSLSNSVIAIETISQSDTEDSSDEVVMIGYIKPPHERTPEVVDLVASDSDTMIIEEPRLNSPIEVVDEMSPSTSSAALTSTQMSPSTLSSSDQPSSSGVVKISLKRKHSRTQMHFETDSENETEIDTRRVKWVKHKTSRKNRYASRDSASTECTDRDTDYSDSSFCGHSHHINSDHLSDSSSSGADSYKKKQNLASKILKNFKKSSLEGRNCDLREADVHTSDDSVPNTEDDCTVSQPSSKQKSHKKSKHKKVSKNIHSSVKIRKHHKSKSKHIKNSIEESVDLPDSKTDTISKEKCSTANKSKAKNRSDIKCSRKNVATNTIYSNGCVNSDLSSFSESSTSQQHLKESSQIKNNLLNGSPVNISSLSSESSPSSNNGETIAMTPAISLHNENPCQSNIVSNEHQVHASLVQFEGNNIFNYLPDFLSSSIPLNLSVKKESDEESLGQCEY